MFFNDATKAMAQKRWDICQECPDFKKKGGAAGILSTCRICGCVMRAKVQLKGASCPVDKWSAEK